MNKVRVAVLGAGGQVGSNLLSLLGNDEKIEAWGICRNEVTAAPLRLAGSRVRVGSVTQPEDAGRLFEGCDVVVNCAAASGPPATARKQDKAIMEALLALPRSIRLIHFSSVGIYGSVIVPRRDGFRHPRPDWDFGRGKLYLEKLIKKSSGDRDVLILRLGHVYGAGQWVSRFVLEAASTAEWRLPFDGRLNSNAVHVRNAAEAVRAAILSGPVSGTFNLVDPGQSTWREIFDWTTDTVGAARVPGLDEENSDVLCSAHRKVAQTSLPIRALGEGLLWMRGLPASFFSEVPASKALGSILLARLKSDRFESIVLKKWNSSFAAVSDAETSYPGYLCSAEAPGPVFRYSAARGDSDQRALRSWYEKMRGPDAILSWAGEHSSGRGSEQVAAGGRQTDSR